MEPELKVQEIVISADDKNQFKRLDLLITHYLSDLSRSTVKRLFEEDHIYADQTELELKKIPAAGTKIFIELPEPIPTDLKPENIPLEILFEDDYLIIINKPAGLVVHPAPGNYTGTLVNAILYLCPDLKGVGAEKRPGIVHRLDKGTSGIMVIAKEQKTHEGLVELFSNHDIERKYEAITLGAPKDLSGKIETLIARHPTQRLKMSSQVKTGKKAVTFFKVTENFTKYAHLELKLETGRTHQIRVHLSQVLHTPILCDDLYGNGSAINQMPSKLKSLLENYPHQLLHAKVLGFVHPITKEKLYFESSPPEIFQAALNFLRENKNENR